MFVVTYKTIFFWMTSILLVGAVGSIAVFGINPSADFLGGSLVEARYTNEAPSGGTIQEALQNAGIVGTSVREAEGNTVVVRARVLTDDERAAIPAILSLNGEYQLEIDRFNEIGPTLGAELRKKAYFALLFVMLAIMLYVAFAFRAVSKPVSSWVYGGIVLAVLAHDILLPTGVLALLGHFVGAQADSLFVVALLTVLGYSVNDTIVVFDRVREKLKENNDRNRRESFSITVGRSIDETYGRSFNTSFTTVLALLALFFFGPAATQDFALILIAGVIAGTYSSIALAAPLLVVVEQWKSKQS